MRLSAEDAAGIRAAMPSVLPWPAPMRPEAFHGPAGELVELVDPCTEADPHGVLVQFLAAAGNVIGTGPYIVGDGAVHTARLWAVLLGETARARKGTAWVRAREPFALAEPGWSATRIVGGLSSGEGLVHQVREKQIGKRKATKEEVKAGEPEWVDAILDLGADDTRLLVVETEFAAPFRAMQRDGNTLSPNLRTLWDDGTGGGLTKKEPSRCRNAHVTVIGHITTDEARQVISDVDVANGLVNRFCLFCVRRSKLLPNGGRIDRDAMSAAARLHETLRSAGQLNGELGHPGVQRTMGARLPAARGGASGRTGHRHGPRRGARPAPVAAVRAARRPRRDRRRAPRGGARGLGLRRSIGGVPVRRVHRGPPRRPDRRRAA